MLGESQLPRDFLCMASGKVSVGTFCATTVTAPATAPPEEENGNHHEYSGSLSGPHLQDSQRLARDILTCLSTNHL